MQFRAYFFPVLTVCTVLAGAHSALAGSKTPPPSNTKLSVEENTKIIEDAKIGQYYNLYERRDEFLKENASFREAIDNRRASYITPMIEARGQNAVVEQSKAAPSDVAPASGDAPSGLSEAGIRAFYAEAETIHHQPLDAYKAWVKNHLHEKARYTLTTTIKLPGASPVVTSRTVTNKEFLETIDENYKAMRGATVKEEVAEIVMAPDGKSAEVKEKSVITGMSVPVDKSKDLRGDGTGACNDKLVFTPGTGIQVLSSVCTLDVTLSASQDL